MTTDLQARLEQALADNARMHTLILRYESGLNDGSCAECGYIGHHKLGCETGMLARSDHAGAALLREVLALRAVVDELRPHAERWKKLGRTLTNGWLEPHEVRALTAACAAADAAREP